MGTNIQYRIDYEKTIEAIVWLANKAPGIDIYHVSKILYYAEKLHLNRYERPIIGDTYIAMPYGQVPSGVRDLITKNTWVIDPKDLAQFSASVETQKDPYDKLTALRSANLDFFSDTDIECLNEAFGYYVNMTFDQLKEISHQDKSWIETEQNKEIDYRLMLDDNEYKNELLEDICKTSHYVRF